jgi:hypothetical protein
LPGRPTELAGGPEGWQFELFDKQKRTVIGFRHRLGKWAGEAAVAELIPLYDRDPSSKSNPPRPGSELTIAKLGFAVGGVHVVAGKHVNAVRIIFVREESDGSLDKGDFYLSEWIGDAGDRKYAVLGDGKQRVLGVCGRRGLIIDALALVVEEQSPQ